MRLRVALTLACLAGVGACARPVQLASRDVAPSDSALSVIDTAFRPQPKTIVIVDSASEQLVVSVKGKSSGPLGRKSKANFAVGRMFTARLQQYTDRIFRLDKRAAPMKVDVSITGWDVQYSSRHGLIGQASLDSVRMQAVLTVNYARRNGNLATRTYTYTSQVQTGGKSGSDGAGPTTAEGAPANIATRDRNSAMVAKAVDGVVQQLMRDVVDRTAALRRGSR
jgi:hypothetical protein